ncbi:MAG: glycosyltransferase family 4 protein [Phycisphaerae bacterium]
MRICHVITRLIIGGAQENTLLTCEGLHQRGHDVTLIAGPTDGPEGRLVERARGGGYRFIELPELRRSINPWTDARAMRELAATYVDLQPEVVHTHSSKAGIVGRFAAARARVPIVVHTIHGMSFNRTQPWFVRAAYSFLERRAARVSDAIVSVADAMTEQSVAARIAPRARFSTIYSGMDIAAFTPSSAQRERSRAAWGVAPDDVIVAVVARLFRNKGYEQLIPVMDAAMKQEPRLRFVWIGDGAQRGEFEAHLRQRGIADRTTLVGLVPPSEIPNLLAGADLLAHASQWEGLPRAVVQGLLMCVPAVAFAIDGTPEVVINDRTGFVVPLGDETAFAARLVELARDAERRRRMGYAGRELCRERFDWRVMVGQLETLYERLHSRRARP